MKTAKMELEISEILILMWALESALERSTHPDGENENDAYAIHQRLQAAWLEIRK